MNLEGLERNMKLKLPDSARRLATGVFEWHNPKNKFSIMALHYSAHPMKDERWVNENRPRMSSIDWDREHEMSDTASTIGQRIFTKFDPELHMGILEPEPDTPILRTWDFGWGNPCVVWSQKKTNKQFYILKEYMEKNIGLDEFYEEVIAITKVFFKGYEINDYCDPYSANQMSDMSKMTRVEFLMSKGLIPVYDRFPIKLGIDLLDLLLTSEIEEDDEKLPMIMVNERYCPIIISGFTGGFIWDKQAKNPYKDGYFEHPLDCLRYTVTNTYDYDEVLERNTGKQLMKEKKEMSGLDAYDRRLIKRIDDDLEKRIKALKNIREVQIG